MQFLADDPSVAIDEAVAASEQRTGFRNAALANYMKSFGVIENPVEHTLGVYFHHCATATTCRQLAMAGRFLVHNGRNPATGLSAEKPERARRINAVMLTCGHDHGSGEFAYRVGLPGKSGVTYGSTDTRRCRTCVARPKSRNSTPSPPSTSSRCGALMALRRCRPRAIRRTASSSRLRFSRTARARTARS